MLMLTVMMHYAGLSQSSDTDTLCFTRERATKVLIAARQKVVLDSVIIRLKADADNYEIALNGLQMALTAYAGKDSAVAASYNREIAIMEQQKKDYAERVKVLEKQLKKEVRNKTLTAFGGLLAVAGVVFLLVR